MKVHRHKQIKLLLYFGQPFRRNFFKIQEYICNTYIHIKEENFVIPHPSFLIIHYSRYKPVFLTIFL